MEWDAQTKRISDLKIAYIGGGSRGWAQALMRDLAMEPMLSGEVRLYDIDEKAAQDNATIGNRLAGRADAVGKWLYKVYPTLDSALTGADFVVLSILPGTFKEMHSDVHTPERLGIYQSVGDTVGPGGAVRALRTIPMYIQFGEAIHRCCPDAWVINYTNPMTVCTRTLYEAFPCIKAFGCCHEVFGTQEDVAFMLRELKGMKDAKRYDIKTNVIGVNHFTWIDRMSYEDLDVMPLWREVAQKYADTGYSRESVGHWRNSDSVFRNSNQVKFDLLLRYGAAAAAGDRHLAEFMPPYYLKDPETVYNWGFALTSVPWRVKDREGIDEHRAKLVSGEAELELKPTGEEGVLQIKALLGLGDFVTNVNVPNLGQADSMPLGAVLETNALFSRDSVRPVFAGRLPSGAHALVTRHVLNQEALVRGFTARNRREICNAFLNDPQLSAVSPVQGEALFDEMLENTKAYLPAWLLQK